MPFILGDVLKLWKRGKQLFSIKPSLYIKHWHHRRKWNAIIDDPDWLFPTAPCWLFYHHFRLWYPYPPKSLRSPWLEPWHSHTHHPSVGSQEMKSNKWLGRRVQGRVQGHWGHTERGHEGLEHLWLVLPQVLIKKHDARNDNFEARKKRQMFMY